MIGSTIFLVGTDVKTGEYVKDACCCSMCKRMVINAGIENVIIRDDKDSYRVIKVSEWIENDESVEGVLGY
jgi:dCMP deaminase